MIDELLLQTGQDIPFPEARITVHNPMLKEIGLIGENHFHPGIQFLTFSIDDLESQDKIGLEGQTDFDIFMSIMLSKEKASYKIDAKMVLNLLFPDYQISFKPEGIYLAKDNFETNINRYNYSNFKQILIAMFDLDKKTEKNYSPADGLAAKIAKKLQSRKIDKTKNNEKLLGKMNIFSRYISILVVGQQKNVNDFNDYTVYQLNDEFKRYQMKESYDMYIQARMAGASDLDEVDNWMEDIHQ